MPTGTFVPFEIHHLADIRKPLRTEERRPRGSVDPEADPVFTEFRFSNRTRLGKFQVANITHRKLVTVEGFYHGTRITEVVQQKVFDAYVDLAQKLFVAHAAKEIATSAVEA